MHLSDIRLRKYITAPIVRNLEFASFMEFEHDYTISKDSATESLERAYFSWKESEKNLPEDGRLKNVLDFEQQLLDVLSRMELRGVFMDTQELRAIGDEIMGEIRRIEAEIYDLVGEPFNINSAKQVQTLLFEKLHIPTSKKIKTGYSVDNEALSLIGEKYEIANMILEYRGLEKLRSTYVDGLMKAVNPKTKRIHTTYNQTQASTGRLSSENPNLQNIPTGGGYAHRIKSCFKPAPLIRGMVEDRGVDSDFTFLVADYSQVELRILASLSGDTALIETFVRGEDIHARTARFLFGDQTTITSELRRIAKSVNFGVVYGIAGFGLSKVINTSPAEANLYIDKFYAMYPKVREYYQTILDGARRDGYVETYFGRRRYVPGVNDGNKMIRSATEREAINMPIQWTAADVIKLAMIELDTFIRSENLRSRMILQVHDELVFEMHQDEKELLESKVRSIMEGVFSGAVKLLVDIHQGGNWAEAKG